ncbi:MAG: histidine phosphatase family protein [Candidatus Saccharimonadales bacterium]
MTVYFIRHGQSEANRDDNVSSDEVQLTEAGSEQAKIAAGLLKDKGITTILVSPLVRAGQTAQIISEELGGIDIVVLRELTERNLGEYKGEPRPENKNFFYELENGRGVETHQELIKRAQKAISGIAEAARSSKGNILVVGHAILGFFMRNIACGHLEYKDFDWSLKTGNAEVVKIEIGKNWGKI